MNFLNKQELQKTLDMWCYNKDNVLEKYGNQFI